MSDRDETENDARRTAAEQDLRATADAVRDDLRRLGAVESEKIALAPEDPKVDDLSDEAVRLAERIRRETAVEREIGKELR
ncbi:MAG TPA: hypothetical protein VGO64_06270 [Candidatus Limnocylindrales bacterium]|jgi:hypothetical protein|nr:hypothetical protein [Candidatus Limnocylindrales bacterium]